MQTFLIKNNLLTWRIFNLYYLSWNLFFLHPKTLLLIHTNGNRRLSKRGTLENFQICRKQYLVKIYLFRTPSILHLTQMRRVSHLLHKSLFDCLPWSIITSFARKKRWNFKNLRQIVRNSRWFPAQFLIRSRRRRRSATKDESLSDVGAAETCSFFVSVWRNLGLAKSVTAAAKNGLVTDFFAVKLLLTSCLDVEVEDFGEVGVSQSVGGEHSHVVHRLVLQVPGWSKASKRSDKIIFTPPQYVRAGGGEREGSRRARLGLTWRGGWSHQCFLLGIVIKGIKWEVELCSKDFKCFWNPTHYLKGDTVILPKIPISLPAMQNHLRMVGESWDVSVIILRLIFRNWFHTKSELWYWSKLRPNVVVRLNWIVEVVCWLWKLPCAGQNTSMGES